MWLVYSSCIVKRKKRKSSPASECLSAFVEDGEILVIDEQASSAFARDLTRNAVVDEPFHRRGCGGKGECRAIAYLR